MSGRVQQGAGLHSLGWQGTYFFCMLTASGILIMAISNIHNEVTFDCSIGATILYAKEDQRLVKHSLIELHELDLHLPNCCPVAPPVIHLRSDSISHHRHHMLHHHLTLVLQLEGRCL